MKLTQKALDLIAKHDGLKITARTLIERQRAVELEKWKKRRLDRACQQAAISDPMPPCGMSLGAGLGDFSIEQARYTGRYE